MPRRRLRVRFVFARGLYLRTSLNGRSLPLTGSEMLRMQMLKDLSPFLPETIDFGISFFGGRFLTFERWLALQRPAVFILSKSLAYSLSEEQIDRLRKKAVMVAVDHKDGDLSKINFSQFDLHVASSFSAERGMKKVLSQQTFSGTRKPTCGLLLQPPDARLPKGHAQPLDALRGIYVGLLGNASIPEEIAEDIESFEVHNNLDMEKVLPLLSGFNFHYAVRPQAPDRLLRSYKPFTKGFTAAALHSNILVNRSVDDALDLLSDDYPYLVSSNTADEVVQMFRYAKDSYGSSEWGRGLRIMGELRSKVAPEAVAHQLSKMVFDAVG